MRRRIKSDEKERWRARSGGKKRRRTKILLRLIPIRRLNDGQTVPGRTRRLPQLVEDTIFNCALINCRSLKPKLTSLKECFIINKLSLCLFPRELVNPSAKSLAKA